jgi:hypothetical protein
MNFSTRNRIEMRWSTNPALVGYADTPEHARQALQRKHMLRDYLNETIYYAISQAPETFAEYYMKEQIK